MHRGLTGLPECTICVEPMVIEQACFHLVVHLDHLDEGVSAAPFLEVFLLHRLVDNFVANLTLGRVAVALDCVHDHLLAREHLPTVWALDIRLVRHFLGSLSKVLGLLTDCTSIEATSKPACAKAALDTTDPASFFLSSYEIVRT